MPHLLDPACSHSPGCKYKNFHPFTLKNFSSPSPLCDIDSRGINRIRSKYQEFIGDWYWNPEGDQKKNCREGRTIKKEVSIQYYKYISRLLSVQNSMVEEGSKEEVSRILRELKADDWLVRQAAVRKIGGICDPETLSELLERLACEKWYVREAAASGIRGLSSSAVVGCLMRTVARGDDILRNASASALGNLKCREAESLLERASSDPDCRIRRSARAALERIREPSA